MRDTRGMGDPTSSPTGGSQPDVDRNRTLSGLESGSHGEGSRHRMMEPMVSADRVLRFLCPHCSATVKERLHREKIVSAADLAGLDKEDLRELGLTMVERSKVLRWACEHMHFWSSRCAHEGGLGSRTQSMEGLAKEGRQLERMVTPETHGGGTPGMSYTTDAFFRDTIPSMDLEPQWRAGPRRSDSINSVDPMNELSDIAEEWERQHLDEVEKRSDFWCKLVANSGAVQLRRDVDQVAEKLRTVGEAGDLRENLLEKLFDLSPERLKEVYDSIDKDSDGQILKDELREGLHKWDLQGLEGALEEVVQAVSNNSGSTIQLPEFVSIVTRLKLAQLLGERSYAGSAAHRARSRLLVMDYNASATRVVEDNLRDYFFGHRSMDYPMRWVHMREFDLTLLLALTAKYQLHPLSVEDVIDQSPTRIDRYGVHYFTAIEMLSLVGPAHGHEPVMVRGRHVTVFCAGPPNLDTVISITQADRSFYQDWPGEVPQVRVSDGERDDVWADKLRRRLKAVRSRVRERRADYLMYEIVDLIVDEMVVVSRTFSARLNWLEDRMVKRANGTEEEKNSWFHEVGNIKLQLAVLARRLRGLQRVIRRLAEDPDLSRVLAGYLQDVADHVNEAYEDAMQMGEKCKTLLDAFERVEEKKQEKVQKAMMKMQSLQDERMNRMLLVLTILTTIFSPLTFLVGIYGMNFQDADGHPTIPELVWPNGYEFFWTVTVVYLVASSIVGVWLWRRLTSTVQPDVQGKSQERASWIISPPARAASKVSDAHNDHSCTHRDGLTPGGAGLRARSACSSPCAYDPPYVPLAAREHSRESGRRDWGSHSARSLPPETTRLLDTSPNSSP